MGSKNEDELRETSEYFDFSWYHLPKRKKEIYKRKEKTGSIELEITETSLEKFKDTIVSLFETYGGEANISFCDNYDSLSLTISYDVEENNEEYADRVKFQEERWDERREKNNKEKVKRIQEEKETLKRLLEKYPEMRENT